MADKLDWLNQHPLWFLYPTVMQAVELNQLALSTSQQELAARFPIAEDYLKALWYNGKYKEACTFCAYNTNPRIAVWWAYLCVVDLAKELLIKPSEPVKISDIAKDRPLHIPDWCQEMSAPSAMADAIDPAMAEQIAKLQDVRMQMGQAFSNLQNTMPPALSEIFNQSLEAAFNSVKAQCGHDPRVLLQECIEKLKTCQNIPEIDEANSPIFKAADELKQKIEKMRVETAELINSVIPEQDPEKTAKLSAQCLDAVWAYLTAPNENNAQTVFQLGNACPNQNEGLLASIAFWSYGSLTPNSTTVVKTPAGLMAGGINGLLTKCATAVGGIYKPVERFERYFNLAFAVLTNQYTWVSYVERNTSPHQELQNELLAHMQAANTLHNADISHNADMPHNADISNVVLNHQAAASTLSAPISTLSAPQSTSKVASQSASQSTSALNTAASLSQQVQQYNYQSSAQHSGIARDSIKTEFAVNTTSDKSLTPDHSQSRTGNLMASRYPRSSRWNATSAEHTASSTEQAASYKEYATSSTEHPAFNRSLASLNGSESLIVSERFNGTESLNSIESLNDMPKSNTAYSSQAYSSQEVALSDYANNANYAGYADTYGSSNSSQSSPLNNSSSVYSTNSSDSYTQNSNTGYSPSSNGAYTQDSNSGYSSNGLHHQNSSGQHNPKQQYSNLTHRWTPATSGNTQHQTAPHNLSHTDMYRDDLASKGGARAAGVGAVIPNVNSNANLQGTANTITNANTTIEATAEATAEKTADTHHSSIPLTTITSTSDALASPNTQANVPNMHNMQLPVSPTDKAAAAKKAAEKAMQERLAKIKAGLNRRFKG